MKKSARNRAKRLQVQRLTYAAVYLALAVLLPQLTGRIPEIGKMLCPMHIPVLLCGFVCGWSWGMAVGLLAPVLGSVTFGMPQLYPTAVTMTFELAAYGCMAGVLHKRLPDFRGRLYVALLIAMIIGRVVWGLANYALSLLFGLDFSPAIFLAGAVLDALPGIILQLVLIPPMVVLMNRAGLDLNRPV